MHLPDGDKCQALSLISTDTLSASESRESEHEHNLSITVQKFNILWNMSQCYTDATPGLGRLKRCTVFFQNACTQPYSARQHSEFTHLSECLWGSDTAKSLTICFCFKVVAWTFSVNLTSSLSFSVQLQVFHHFKLKKNLKFCDTSCQKQQKVLPRVTKTRNSSAM